MIEFTRAEVATGGVVSGRLVVRPGRSAPAGATHAWLVWRTQAKAWAALGDGTAMEEYFVIDRRPIGSSPDGYAFEFRVPEQGPVSYDGTLFRVVWEVVVGGMSPAPEPVASAAFAVVARPASGE